MIKTDAFTPDDVKALARQFSKRREAIREENYTFLSKILRKTGVKKLRAWIRK